MSIEEELKINLKNPLALVLTILTVVLYLLVFATFMFNRPDPTVFNMSMPLLYTLLLWVVIIVVVMLAAYKLWR